MTTEYYRKTYTLMKWADDWTMEFNITTRKSMQITAHYNKSTLV